MVASVIGPHTVKRAPTWSCTNLTQVNCKAHIRLHAKSKSHERIRLPSIEVNESYKSKVSLSLHCENESVRGPRGYLSTALLSSLQFQYYLRISLGQRPDLVTELHELLFPSCGFLRRIPVKPLGIGYAPRA